MTATVIDHAIELDFGATGSGEATAATTRRRPTATTSWTSSCRAARPAEHHFYRLLGDVTGDGVVDNNDLNAIAAELGNSSPDGMTPLDADVNGDGSVTAMDTTLAGIAGQGPQARIGPAPGLSRVRKPRSMILLVLAH